MGLDKIVKTRLTELELKKFDEAIQKGGYSSRSDAIRFMIRMFINEHEEANKNIEVISVSENLMNDAIDFVKVLLREEGVTVPKGGYCDEYGEMDNDDWFFEMKYDDKPEHKIIVPEKLMNMGIEFVKERLGIDEIKGELVEFGCFEERNNAWEFIFRKQ